MPFNGSGVFQRLYNWLNDKNAGVKIRSDRMDAEMDGFATGLSNCITKDGQTTITANLPMAGFKHTGVANATARTDYAAFGQMRDGVFCYCGSVSGTATAILLTYSPPYTAYVAGMKIRFILASSPTGATTVNVDGLGAKDLKRFAGTAIASGDFTSGEVIEAVYTGTEFRVTNAGRNAQTITGSLVLANIPNSLITKAKLENLASMKVLGNVSGSAAAPAEVSILDEDNMASNSATALATQQSIKAYVDAAAVNTGTAVSHSTTNTVNNGSWTTLAFDTEAYDDGNLHDLVTNNSRITVSATGRYLVNGFAEFGTNANGDIGIAIAVNGTRVRTDISDSGTTSENHKRCISSILSLTAADYVELQVFQQTGSGSTTTSAGTGLSLQRLK